jgi:hypothetical protein
VATTSFEPLAAGVAETLDLPDMRIVAVEHPLGGIDEAAVIGRAEEAVESTLRLLTGAR